MRLKLFAISTAVFFIILFTQMVSACDFTANLVATQISDSAPFVVNLKANIVAAFGPFGYANYSCGTSGTVSNQNQNEFTCTYTSPGTYTPSLEATIKPPPSCTEKVSTSVTVTAGNCKPNCACAADTCTNATC